MHISTRAPVLIYFSRFVRPVSSCSMHVSMLNHAKSRLHDMPGLVAANTSPSSLPPVRACMQLHMKRDSICQPDRDTCQVVHVAGKEYGKADSRYVTRDSFVISMEAFTAFVVGPMCFWAVLAMVRQHSWRHVLQLVVSVCQLYGDVLYFATTGMEGTGAVSSHMQILLNSNK